MAARRAPQHRAAGRSRGDTGVYVWNLWVFQHELLDHRTLPYLTDTIFSTTGRANLSLHNYTAFANVLALPLVRAFGVVATFNAVYLALTVLTAYCMFLLALHVTDDDGPVSWLAGVLLAWSPVLVTRGLGHFSLVAAAPLPVFVLLDAGPEGCSIRHAAAFGIVVAWATACDVYFGVYCLMAAAGVLVAQSIRVIARGAPTPAGLSIQRGLDVLAVSVGGLVVTLLTSRGWEFVFLGHVVRIRTVYTPLLVLSALMAAKITLKFRLTPKNLTAREVISVLRVIATAGIVCSILMSPLLFAIGMRIEQGTFVSPHIFWRSSPPGVDLLAWLAPNPNHPLAPASLRSWIDGLTRDGYLENVVSVPFIALAVVFAAWRGGWRAPKFLLAVAGGFGVLALGPFFRIGGVDTHIPGPWALLRDVPLVGLARSPSRFAIFAVVGFTALFAGAFHALAERHGERRIRFVAVVGALLLFELLPAPRPLASATIPSVYSVIAADRMTTCACWNCRSAFQTAHEPSAK